MGSGNDDRAKFCHLGDVALLSPFVGMRHIEISLWIQTGELGFVVDGSGPSAVKGCLHKNCQNGYGAFLGTIGSESGGPLRGRPSSPVPVL